MQNTFKLILYGNNDEDTAMPIICQMHYILSANSHITDTVWKLILKEFIDKKTARIIAKTWQLRSNVAVTTIKATSTTTLASTIVVLSAVPKTKST